MISRPRNELRIVLLITALVAGASGAWAGPQITTRGRTAVRHEVPPKEAGESDVTGPRIIAADPVPGAWITTARGLARLTLTFDEDVIVPLDAVSGWTVGGGAVSGITTAFDAEDDTLTVRFTPPVQNDILNLVVDYTVTDGVGNGLDGEVFAPAINLLPSGDGIIGGQAVIRYSILEGDLDQDGIVRPADLSRVEGALGACIGEDGYRADADLEPDGCITVLDVAVVKPGISLPEGDGGAPQVVSASAVDDTTLRVTFGEPLAPASFNPHSAYLIAGDGTRIIPTSGTLAVDGRSADYVLSNPLTPCAVYSVRLSNALGDASGELLELATPPALGGAAEPPQIDAVADIVSTPSVTVTGTAEMGATVQVDGPLNVQSVVATDGTFSVDVDLELNSINTINFATQSTCDGTLSAPVAITVTQDSTAPEVFIDFPPDGAELEAASTAIAGRVSDLLNGYKGLTVTVNGVPAQVNIGIGTNGTFFLPDLPLAVGPNVITAEAADALGNVAQTQATITRLELPPDTPRISLVSGDGQTARVNAVLPDPIIVELLQADGVTPFAGKLVTFEVTRSDGRLALEGQGDGKRMMQVHTDAQGRAEVYWRLGMDAGSGNNRLEARSTGLAGTVAFCASATPAPPVQINVGTGHNQRGEAGAPAPEPLRVWVSDGCNGAAGIPVTFTVVRGGGTVNGTSQTTVITGPTGHVEVDAVLGLQPGNTVVEANFGGNPSGPAMFVLNGIARDLSGAAPTTFSGLVLDNANRPIEGALCTLKIGRTVLPTAVTDAEGQFAIADIPGSGAAELYVDGSTALSGTYPSLKYHPVIIPNAANSLPTPVLLPTLNPMNRVAYGGDQDVVLTIAGIDGLEMSVPAGTRVTLPSGDCIDPDDPACTGEAGCTAEFGFACVALELNQVRHDKIPMPMTDGAAPPFAWTLQPSGTTFDPPMKVTYPNMSGLPAGAIAYFLSFDHDTMRFEIVSSGQVTNDGQCVVSDPGDGIAVAGWGCNCPPYSVTATCESDQPPVEPPPCPNGDSPPGAPGCEGCGGAGAGAGGSGGSGPGGGPNLDPVHLFSGEFYLNVEDLRIPGRGLDFVWTRKYRSRFGRETAQGYNWDFSYNIFLEEAGAHFYLCDGNGRRDLYGAKGTDRWVRGGWHRELVKNGDDTLTMIFPDSGQWVFHAFDGTPQEGKIAAIIDRNGNELTLAYDGSGRLQTITDTLGRDITVAYNLQGYIESVTDFAGRQVRYAYYDDGDAEGGLGDLESVTTPAVTGTPTGNDFPDGKTTVYTYSTGFNGRALDEILPGDGRDHPLNHNLLTITDGKGQEYLRNTYYANETKGYVAGGSATGLAVRPGPDMCFDRLIRQSWGNTQDVVDINYSCPPGFPFDSDPGPGNFLSYRGFPVNVHVNDRVGNNSDFEFDARNRLIRERHFAGRVRPGDPEFYETRYAYNKDSRVTKVTHANGNITEYVYETDVNPSPGRRSRGNIREIRHLPGDHTPVGDQAELVESFEYDTDMGGCCGFNFVTKYTDARGAETVHDYDENGNRIHTQHRIPSIVEDWEYNAFGQVTAHVLPDNGGGHRRRDEYTYYEAGPQAGYLHEAIVDATDLALTTTYEYDTVGNVTRMTDPRGADEQYIVNQLNQVVRSISRETAPGSGIRYQRDIYYDANDNVVREDVQNLDETGQVPADGNTHLTTVYEYEILNNVTRVCQESGSYTGTIPGTTDQPTCDGLPDADFVTTTYAYDGNRNQVYMQQGEAANGNQPYNAVQTLYDERDLVFRRIIAPGDPHQSSTQYDYDGNRNEVRVVEGLEGEQHITTYTYDAYDRMVASTDPMGNVTELRYDANGNVGGDVEPGVLHDFGTRVFGELDDVDGSAGNQLLSEQMYEYDAMDRLVVRRSAFFDTATGTPIDDGQSTTTLEYNDNSQIVRVVNDNGHQALTAYDTANREALLTDQLGNTVAYDYDANSNLIARTETELSDLGSPQQEFLTTFEHDGLDRLISETQHAGPTLDNVFTYGYDSRDNEVVAVDANGHEVRHAYDGLDRRLATVRDLDGDSDTDGIEADFDEPADIVTSQQWDASSRLIAQIDDSGNATRYAYDALDRLVATQMADGTLDQNGSNLTWPLGVAIPDLTGFSNGHDVHGNVLTHIDANGSVVTSTYDDLDRVIGRSIIPGPGVSNDTTFEVFKYDGLSRLVHAEDDDSIVTRAYDSLSHVTTEILNGQSTVSLYDGVGNMTECIYPGGRHITTTYDGLERKKVISDTGGMIATYDYIGPDRVERKTLGNGTRTDYVYDGIMGEANEPGDFGFKRIVRTTHVRESDDTIIDDYAYTWDRVYTKTQRADLRPDGPLTVQDFTYDKVYRLIQSETGPDGGPTEVITYTYDGVGNRTLVTGGPDPGAYVMDPGDLPVNQYTQTPFDARTYDDNGNLATIDQGLPTQKTLMHDYRNQMTSYVLGGGEPLSMNYKYDAVGRRISKAPDDSPASVIQYYYNGSRVGEEQNGRDLTRATYVYGNYVDELLTMWRAAEEYFIHSDDNYNTTGITSVLGDAVERVSYGDFGTPYFWDDFGLPSDKSGSGNPILFTGRRYDREPGWLFYRSRYLDPLSGRFQVPDARGVWHDGFNVGNAFAYVGNSPVSRVDPFGTDGVDTLDKILGGVGTVGGAVSVGLAEAGKQVASRCLGGVLAAGAAGWTLGRALDEWLNISDEIALGGIHFISNTKPRQAPYEFKPREAPDSDFPTNVFPGFEIRADDKVPDYHFPGYTITPE